MALEVEVVILSPVQFGHMAEKWVENGRKSPFWIQKWYDKLAWITNAARKFEIMLRKPGIFVEWKKKSFFSNSDKQRLCHASCFTKGTCSFSGLLLLCPPFSFPLILLPHFFLISPFSLISYTTYKTTYNCRPLMAKTYTLRKKVLPSTFLVLQLVTNRVLK